MTFNAANLKTALEISEAEGISNRNEIIENHLNLIKSPAVRNIIRYCLNPADKTKSPCLAVIEENINCPDDCPISLGELCQVIGVPSDKDLATRLILNRKQYNSSSKTSLKLGKELL